jgi:5-oxoprolinase (ATP-hydrolysing) subunit C
MSKLVVVSAGPAITVQDAGRQGVQRYGLPPSGAMDRAALAMANCLAGNPIFTAAIEIGPFGAVFSARDGAVRVALAGAGRNADIAGQSVHFNRTLLIPDHASLRIGPAREGAFSYLAIEGGIHGAPMFGSLAVNVRAGIGSPFPRALEAGDSFAVDDIRPLHSERRLDVPALGNASIRVVLGPQDDEFDAAAIALFLDSEWTLTAASDRMGYRLGGPRLVHTHGHNIVSDGTVTGSIQVPGSGQPIVLMADRGTTGGYPKIATVISADLGRFAQTRAGQRFRFQAVSMADAQAEARRFHDFLTSLPQRITDVSDVALNLAALHNANLAGVAVNAIDTVTWQTPTKNAGN